MTIHHAHLYAPSLVLCPSDEDLLLERNNYPYFSLFGPSTVMPFYEFLNFSTIGDTLEGQIILDNSNNNFPSCLVSFETPVTQGTTGIIEKTGLEAKIFPNPACDFLHFRMNEHDQAIRKIYFVNSFGQKQEVSYNAERIDLRQYPAGLYLVLFELNDGSRLARKVMVSK
jgi:hypothetical protein